jgi:hypothetical protein
MAIFVPMMYSLSPGWRISLKQFISVASGWRFALTLI